MSGKRKKTVAVHPDRPCADTCSVKDCEHSLRNVRTYHISNFDEERRAFCREKLFIQDDSCLCCKCYLAASKAWKGETSPATVPSSKKQAKEKVMCMLSLFSMCDASSTHSAVCDDWPLFVAEMGLEVFSIEPQASVSLCNSHYMKWYRAGKATHCGVCSKQFKSDHRMYNIPDYPLLHAHFEEVGDEKAAITEDQKVCAKCYHDFLKLKKKLDQISFSDSVTTDEDLILLMTQYEEYIRAPANPENVPLHQAIVYCLKRLIKHSAFLLSDVYGHYRHCIDRVASSSETSVPSYFTPSTLLSKLMLCLSSHMRHYSIPNEPSMGTLLWRKGDNTVDLLLRNLHAQRKNKSSNEQSAETSLTFFSEDDVDTLQQAAVILHSDVKDLSVTFCPLSRLQDFSQLDLKEIITAIPPRLWNFLYIITENEAQKNHREQSVNPGWFNNSPYTDSRKNDFNHRHHLRILYEVCHMIFAHDDRCGYPLHTLLGEVVHGLGGADELIRIMNRFGMVSSSSKIRDYELDFMYAKLKYGQADIFTDGAFCFASIDNVDKSTPHATVKASGAQRGIHATSCQIVEPKPTRLNTSEKPVQVAHYAAKKDVSLPSNISVKDIEKLRSESRPPFISWEQSPPSRFRRSICSFKPKMEEQHALEEVKSALLAYAVSKLSLLKASPQEVDRIIFPDINLICPRPENVSPEQSKVYYFGVLNEHADNINTVKEVVETLHEEIVNPRQLENLIIVGDGKTYFHLVKLKEEYATELSWMIPFPGDWHTLKNLQPVLMKVYWHSGLEDLASCVHKGATLASLLQCSNFRRTHNFLILAWEAILRHQLAGFQEYVAMHTLPGVSPDFINDVMRKVVDLPLLDATSGPSSMLEVWTLLGGGTFSTAFADFRAKMCSNETYKFWDSFVHRDGLLYIAMFIAMRTGNWNLRLASLKLMAPLFHAFDRPTYLRLIPRHIADVLQMPEKILKPLENGGFVASLKGLKGRNVAADECHEMKINKEVKMAMAKPIASMMDRMALLLPYRATAIERLKEEVTGKEIPHQPSDINLAEMANMEAKVRIYQDKLTETVLAGCTPTEETVPLQTLSGLMADPVQREDMLSFYETGLQSLDCYIKDRIVGEPSVKAPQRKKRLKTFQQKKKRQSKVSLKAKNARLVTRCLRKIIVNSKNTCEPIETLGQFIKLPLAIATAKGSMVHGNKSNTTNVFRRRYPQAFSKSFPTEWKPDCVILEGMFLINSGPLRSARTFRDYTLHVFKNFVFPRFSFGAKEVHIVFDDPERNGISPKDLERERRDDLHDAIGVTSVGNITAETELPDRSNATWRQLMLEDRGNKRALVSFLSKDLLAVSKDVLREGQKLVSAGGLEGSARDQAWSATKEGITTEISFTSNHEESDSRVWLHCLKSVHKKVLVFSPDTDTYHIGLPILAAAEETKDVLVQLSMKMDNKEYIQMNVLLQCLQTDPDLGMVNKDDIASIIQSVYVASGCDFTSFFYGCGKASFLSAFYMYAEFITGLDGHGSLSDYINEGGLLAFYRLVGCTYFQKFSSVMPVEYKSPKQLFQSFNEINSPVERHCKWLDCIRDHSWEKVEIEEDVMPSNDALRFHWMRCCWVFHLWRQAALNEVHPEDVTRYGYFADEGKLSVVWDSAENFQRVDELVGELTNGCKCKSGCSTRRCSCVKAHRMCKAGCSCTNCRNPHNSRACPQCSSGTDELILDVGLDDITAEENHQMQEIQVNDTVMESDTDGSSSDEAED